MIETVGTVHDLFLMFVRVHVPWQWYTISVEKISSFLHTVKTTPTGLY